MKSIKSKVLALAALGAAHAFAVPVVDNVTMTQETSSRRVTIEYTLSGEPGVITVDIQTNATVEGEAKWVSIGNEHLLGFGGDVHKVVQPTGVGEVRTINWHPDIYWPGTRADKANARAVVTAWALNAPPDYCIVHLVAPYDVTYYPCAELVPGGITDKRYKGEYMAFRKIPAAGVTWWSGRLPTSVSYYSDVKRHRVMLTHDYYMAIYELTLSQSSAIADGTPDAGLRIPASWLCFSYLRGAELGSKWPTFNADGSLDYDTSHGVDPGTRLGLLRERTGLLVDLPTEAQWEFAARAGSPGDIYTDEIVVTASATSADLMKLARTASNVGEVDCEGLEGNNQATVGSYAPNAWGLYDMLGNVQEVCLDWFESWETQFPDDDKVYIDPVGPSSGVTKSTRGGSFEGNISGAAWYDITLGGGRRNSKYPGGLDSYGGEGARFCIHLR